MPILPPLAGANPYDSMSSILDIVRMRLDDMIGTPNGDIFTNDQPYTQVAVNIAWRKLQAYLGNLGFSRNRKEAVIQNVPMVQGYDPSIQTWMSYTQYFDGKFYWNTLYLPQDMLFPLKLWERPTGFNCIFWPMSMALDGLPEYGKCGRNSWWEMRGDTMYFCGSTVAMDLKMRYAAYLPDFLNTQNAKWYTLPVPIPNCQDALSNYIAAEIAAPRGDLDAASFTAAAEQAAKLIANREISAKQRTTTTRQPYGRRNYHCY